MPPAKKTRTSAAAAKPGAVDRLSTSTSSKKRPAPPRDEEEEEDDEEEEKRRISPKVLGALMHEHFTKDDTRITKDASAAVAKYFDVFVREAIARALQEKGKAGFLEVEDLEKIAPQLLLDL